MTSAKAVLAAVLSCLVLCSGNVVGQAQTPVRTASSPAVKAQKFLRTELYFGRSKPDGTVVSNDDWKRFLAEVVTTRFPDGFTAITATGQYKDHNGNVISEASEVLVFLYPRNTRAASGVRIEEIRTTYVKQFQQESVIRLDFKSSVGVYF